MPNVDWVCGRPCRSSPSANPRAARRCKKAGATNEPDLNRIRQAPLGSGYNSVSLYITGVLFNMFDLFRSRDKLVRILLGGLLLVVAFSMLTYLVPSYNSGGGSGSDLIVAEIGKDTITLPEMQRSIQLTIRARQLPMEILPTYIPQIVDGMVTERALVLEAERLGMQVSDTEVVELIRQTIPNLLPDGKFVGKDIYAAMLAQNNMTIEEFEADLKRQVLISRLRDIAMEGTIVTPLEIEQAFHKKNDKIKVEYVKLNAAKYTAESQPSAKEMQDFFTVNQARY